MLTRSTQNALASSTPGAAMPKQWRLHELCEFVENSAKRTAELEQRLRALGDRVYGVLPPVEIASGPPSNPPNGSLERMERAIGELNAALSGVDVELSRIEGV